MSSKSKKQQSQEIAPEVITEVIAPEVQIEKRKRGRPTMPEHLKKPKYKVDENGNRVKRGRPPMPDHLKKQKSVRLDENGNPIEVKRGRPTMPDHLKKPKFKLDEEGNRVKRGRPTMPEHLKKQKVQKLDANGNPVKRGRPKQGSNKDGTMNTFEITED